MTRINLVYPEDLADQHLFAEWREIKMIVPAAHRSLKAGTALSIPYNYTLNQGHVKFFYNKMYWLRRRYVDLGHELTTRGYQYTPWEFGNDSFYEILDSPIRQIPWQPTKKDIQINIERITQRLKEKAGWYRYRGEIKPTEFFTDRYNQQLLVDELVG